MHHRPKFLSCYLFSNNARNLFLNKRPNTIKQCPECFLNSIRNTKKCICHFPFKKIQIIKTVSILFHSILFLFYCFLFQFSRLNPNNLASLPKVSGAHCFATVDGMQQCPHGIKHEGTPSFHISTIPAQESARMIGAGAIRLGGGQVAAHLQSRCAAALRGMPKTAATAAAALLQSGRCLPAHLIRTSCSELTPAQSTGGSRPWVGAAPTGYIPRLHRTRRGSIAQETLQHRARHYGARSKERRGEHISACCGFFTAYVPGR